MAELSISSAIGARLLLGLFFFARACAAPAQEIPEKGAPGTLDVATWNIREFGDPTSGPPDAQQLANVAHVMLESEIDLWAIQEIDAPGIFDSLLKALGPDWDGIQDQASTNLRTAFIFKEDVIRPRQARPILEAYDYEFAGRPPLQMEAAVTVGDQTREITFITLHMKAFNDAQAYERRVEAARRLKDHIDHTALADEAVIVLGDFNDHLTGSIRTGWPSPFAPFIEDSTQYRFATSTLEEKGLGTYCFDASCSSSSLIDHILISDELFSFTAGFEAQRFDELLRLLPSYRSTTSDHLPAIFRFSFTSTVSAGRPPASALEQISVYPIPFGDELVVEYDASAPGDVRAALYDLLGREVARLERSMSNAGTVLLRFRLQALEGGAYLLRLATGGGEVSRIVIRAGE